LNDGKDLILVMDAWFFNWKYGESQSPLLTPFIYSFKLKNGSFIARFYYFILYFNWNLSFVSYFGSLKFSLLYAEMQEISLYVFSSIL
jgi:hypothetical protein